MVFELDSGIIAVAIGMILGENVEGLLWALLGYKPTRRLRDPPDENNLDERGDTLNDGDGSPGPVTVDSNGAKGNKCAD